MLDIITTAAGVELPFNTAEAPPDDKLVVVEGPKVVVVVVVCVVVVVEVVVVVVVVEVAYSNRVAELVRLLHSASGHWHSVQPPVKSQVCTGVKPIRPQPRAVSFPLEAIRQVTTPSPQSMRVPWSEELVQRLELPLQT